MDRYIEKNGKKMRYGYTTGSCAAAASKAATLALFTKDEVAYMSIDTPKGWNIDIEVDHVESDPSSATCSVTKDAGDDPDVTHGIKIYATVIKSSRPGVTIEGGIGVGRVTKKGLRVAVGQAAINPVPLQMITEEVQKVLPEGCGVNVVIYVPEGVEVAKKTFNSKLGIIGGISILGTSGIVEPMSEDAFRESLKMELSVKVASGITEVIYVFGNFGRDFLGSDYTQDQMLKTSNFVAYMMEAAAELGIKKLVYVGHAGKMVKVASGMPNTHSKYGDGRMASVVACLKEATMIQEDFSSKQDDLKVLEEALLVANTTDEAVEILEDYGYKDITMNQVAKKCKSVCQAMAKGKVQVECVVFTTIYGELARTSQAKEILEAMKK